MKNSVRIYHPMEGKKNLLDCRVAAEVTIFWKRSHLLGRLKVLGKPRASLASHKTLCR